jgi:hypothetical protein
VRLAPLGITAPTVLTSHQTNAQLVTTATQVLQSQMTQTIFAQEVTIVPRELKCPFTVPTATIPYLEQRVPLIVLNATPGTTVSVKSTLPLCGNVHRDITAS